MNTNNTNNTNYDNKRIQLAEIGNWKLNIKTVLMSWQRKKETIERSERELATWKEENRKSLALKGEWVGTRDNLRRKNKEITSCNIRGDKYITSINSMIKNDKSTTGKSVIQVEYDDEKMKTEALERELLGWKARFNDVKREYLNVKSKENVLIAKCSVYALKSEVEGGRMLRNSGVVDRFAG